MTKILFVCHGNICRSPMAEFVMKDLVQKAGLIWAAPAGRATKDGSGAAAPEADFVIASAATSREEIGNPVYPPARRKLADHGIGVPGNDLGVSTKRARQITGADYAYYDIILCMDHNNLRNLRRVVGEDTEGKVRLLLDYAGRPGAEVADPWYTGDFEATWNDVLAGCRGLLEDLRAESTGACTR